MKRLDSSQIELLNQIVSRTDMSGNEKVSTLKLFIESLLNEPKTDNVCREFDSREDLQLYVQLNTPIAITPSRPSKSKFIYPFSSGYAQMEVIEAIVENLLK